MNSKTFTEMIRVVFLLFFWISSLALAEWDIEEPAEQFPEELKGEIFGREFSFGSAVWRRSALFLNSKDIRKDGLPESQLVIFIDRVKAPYVWSFNQRSKLHSAPQIHMKFTKAEEVFGSLSFTSEYLLYLKLVRVIENTAEFLIHLSLPDYKKSYVLGSFDADIRD